MTNEKKIGVISLGCDKNRVDTEYMLGIIENSPYKLTPDINAAQVIVINTCAFLQASRSEAIDTVMDCNALRKAGLEKIVVTGCLSQKYINEIFDDLAEVDVFLGTKDYDLLPEALNLAYTGKRVNFVGKKDAVESKKRVLSTPSHYAYLKIAEGCDNMCTYCLIPKIRGKYASVAENELVKSAAALGSLDELILVAQDITRYGSDIYGKNSLARLIEKLSALKNVRGIRLLYCYPDLIDKTLIEQIRDNSKVIKYLDMPLQHSEDRILKLMNRKGGRQSYLELIHTLKSEIPGIALRSTFISGFPGETKDEHEAMLGFLDEAQLFNAGFFAYSREAETPAYSFPEQVNENEKKRRVRALYARQNKIAKDILRSYIGKPLNVICDFNDSGLCSARAYFSAPEIDTLIYFNSKDAAAGKRYTVTAKAVKGMDIYAEISKTEPPFAPQTGDLT